ncbi:hypothetical protein ACQKK5_07990 [Brevibacillus panacihumi]
MTYLEACDEIRRNLRIIAEEIGIYRLLDWLERLLTKKGVGE